MTKQPLVTCNIHLAMSYPVRHIRLREFITEKCGFSPSSLVNLNPSLDCQVHMGLMGFSCLKEGRGGTGRAHPSFNFCIY